MSRVPIFSSSRFAHILSGALLTKFSSLMITITLTLNYGLEITGIVTFFIATVSLSTSIGSLGLGNLLVSQRPEHHSRPDLVQKLLLGVVTTVIFHLTFLFFNDKVYKFFLDYAASSVLSSPFILTVSTLYAAFLILNQLLFQALTSKEKTIPLVQISLFRLFSTGIVIFMITISKLDLSGILQLLVLIEIATAFYSLLFLRRFSSLTLPISYSLKPKVNSKMVLSTGLVNLALSVSFYLLAEEIATAQDGAIQIAIYSILIKISSLVSIIPSTLSLSQILDLRASPNNEVQTLFKNCLKSSLYILFVIFIISIFRSNLSTVFDFNLTFHHCIVIAIFSISGMLNNLLGTFLLAQEKIYHWLISDLIIVTIIFSSLMLFSKISAEFALLMQSTAMYTSVVVISGILILSNRGTN
jgi:hypothetical protein